MWQNRNENTRLENGGKERYRQREDQTNVEKESDSEERKKEKERLRMPTDKIDRIWVHRDTSSIKWVHRDTTSIIWMHRDTTSTQRPVQRRVRPAPPPHTHTPTHCWSEGGEGFYSDFPECNSCSRKLNSPHSLNKNYAPWLGLWHPRRTFVCVYSIDIMSSRTRM